MKDKPKTIKDIDLDRELIKAGAIKYFIHGIKFKKNLAKMFLDFHDITNEEVCREYD